MLIKPIKIIANYAIWLNWVMKMRKYNGFFDAIDLMIILCIIILLVIIFFQEKAFGAESQIINELHISAVDMKDRTCREIAESARASLLIQDSSLAQETLSTDMELKISYRMKKSCLEEVNPHSIIELKKLSIMKLSAEKSEQQEQQGQQLY